MSLLQPVLRARRRALWLEEALAAEPEAEDVATLTGAHRADVCIVGGGYTGLWTALHIKWLDPSVEVMLLEADLCGTGASGRNGGFVTTWWTKLRQLIAMYGEAEGMRLARGAADGVVDIGRVCAEYGIDADYRPGGTIIAATAPAHLHGLDGMVRAARDRGVDVFQELSPADTARRSGSAVHLGGVWDSSGARVQPALLARGLRRVALLHGVRIWERSPVVEIVRGRPPVARTAIGGVIADKVVLATNAWLASLPELRRAVLPMSSDMVATAPIAQRLAEIGWTGDECIADEHLMVHYYRTTRDGRIAFGKGGCSHAYLGRITQQFEDPGRRVALTEGSFRRIYPMLADVPITHTWTGPIDRSETNSLFFGHLDGNPDIIYGVGYSGTGVGPSYLGGRILASTALVRRDEWQESPINRGPRSLYPYDPVRYFGGNAVRAAVLAKEADLNAGRASQPVVEFFHRFVPSGLRQGRHY
jgi:glycine/D-amino acid oxidase-like deaminating enzyme